MSFAAFKLLYLALKNIARKWARPTKKWSAAMNQFAIIFEGRVPMRDIDQNSFTQSV
jgi:putative transposase